MKQSPLVSIAIPTRNRKELLGYAIRSVLAQTYAHIQLVIQDNNSQDGTQKFVQEFNDSRLEYYRSDQDLAMTENWNLAFQHTRGEYFLRLDDDNILANDFIEKAFEAICENDLDLIIYSPLIVNHHNKVTTLFVSEKQIYYLDRFQEVYLEYFNLIDSNYVFYKMETVIESFPDRKIYYTTLPDRYMNYCLVSKIKKLRVGMSSEIKGVTRFDYRTPLMQDYRLSYVDYDQLDLQDILKLKDCLSNFHMHRANTLNFFLNTSASPEIKKFFQTKVIHPALIRTLMKLGHIYMAREAYSCDEWKIYNKYVAEIFIQLISRPFARFEARGIFLNVLAIGRNTLLGNVRSLVNIFFQRQRKVMEVNPLLGNNIVEQMITGKEVLHYSTGNEYGVFSSLLRKVDRMML